MNVSEFGFQQSEQWEEHSVAQQQAEIGIGALREMLQFAQVRRYLQAVLVPTCAQMSADIYQYIVESFLFSRVKLQTHRTEMWGSVSALSGSGIATSSKIHLVEL